MHIYDLNRDSAGLAAFLQGLFRVSAEGLGRVSLVRVRNPWGDKNEWKGEFMINVKIDP